MIGSARLWLILLAAVWAGPQAAAGRLDALSSEQRQDVEQGDIAVVMRDIPGSAAREGVAYGLISAPPEKIWAVITAYDRYAEFMPRTLESKVRRREGEEVDFYSQLSMPWPVGKVSYVIRLRHALDRSHIDWEMLPGSGEGVKTNRGGWELLPQGKRTLVVYRLFFEPEGWVPTFLVDTGTRISLREVIRAVRQQLRKEKN